MLALKRIVADAAQITARMSAIQDGQLGRARGSSTDGICGGRGDDLVFLVGLSNGMMEVETFELAARLRFSTL